MRRFLVNRAQGSNGPVILTLAKARFVTQQVLAACGGLDAVVDGAMDDPRVCTPAHFDIHSLQCQAEAHEACLTTAQPEGQDPKKRIAELPVLLIQMVELQQAPSIASFLGLARLLKDRRHVLRPMTSQ